MPGHNAAVVVAGNANPHPLVSVRATDSAPHALHGRHSCLHQYAMLRVDVHCFRRAESEDTGVEVLHAGQQPSEVRTILPRRPSRALHVIPSVQADAVLAQMALHTRRCGP